MNTQMNTNTQYPTGLSQPFFAVLKASTSASKPHLYQVHRKTEQGSEWIANGVSMAHANALAQTLNDNLQRVLTDYLSAAQRHPSIVATINRPVFIVRDEDDTPMASRQLRWTLVAGEANTEALYALYMHHDADVQPSLILLPGLNAPIQSLVNKQIDAVQ